MKNKLLNKNPLFDEEFLNDLFNYSQREVYARISLLTINEEPLEQIEGKITDGSINIDGSSAVRRTCNLNMVAENVNINEFYWGLNSKFKLEIGLKNFINFNYPEIIWFKQGLFVITQFNTNQTTNKWTIKIQGKDKMCLLNGDVSGKLPPTDFAREQYTDLLTGEISFIALPIKTIIQKLLQEFALEQPHNIIINDIDESGQELLEYRGENPLYFFKNADTNEFQQMTIDENLSCYYQLKEIISIEEYYSIPDEYNSLKEVYDRQDTYYYLNKDNLNKIPTEYLISDWFKGKVSDSFMITYDDLLDDEEFEGGKTATVVRFARNGLLNNELFTLVKIEYGDIPGYRLSDLVYPGELKSSAGETITSVLDKIKNKFTNFEYFYDIDGKFVFQKKKDYIVTSWNHSAEQDSSPLYTNAGISNDKVSFTFTNGTLISSFANTPKLLNLKNDFSVHGNRDNMAIRMRYAIDNKPITYKPIRVLKEVIMTINRDKTNKIIDIIKENKYYDAPEMEPYNDFGLIGVDTAFQVIDMLEGDRIAYSEKEIGALKEKINMEAIGADFYNSWFNLFQINEKDKTQYLWHGTAEDIKNMAMAIVQYENINDTWSSLSIIPTLDGGETWILICPYFADYEYSTKHVALDNNTKEIVLFDTLDFLNEKDDNKNNKYTLIHYKVDWRELIYQMSLDYRKLNMTDNYYYYLKESNPTLTLGKTGYEQYYIDMSLWRDLYNPNPELLFNEQLSADEVNKYTLLMDDSEDNDNKDLIYIKNGYRVATRRDKDNISYLNTYMYSAPDDTQIYSIYPYYTSQQCKLATEGVKYYLENDITKRIEIAYTGKDRIVANYDKLSYPLPNKIYIKNDQAFETQDKEVFQTIPQDNFNVLEYPISAAFEQVYGDGTISNYIVFAESKFEDFKESLSDADWVNGPLYVKDDGYIKLSKKDNPLWELYYCSDIYQLAFKTMETINALDSLVNLFSNYNTNSIGFNKKILDIYKSYIVYLNGKEYCEDIKIILYDLLCNQYNNYYKKIISLINEIINSQSPEFNENTSCLNYIFKVLKTNMENSNLNILNSDNINEQLLNILSVFTNLDLCIQSILTNIESNFYQVNFITSDVDLANNLIIDENDTSFTADVQWNRINNLKTELSAIQDRLDTVKSLYKHGQVQKTSLLISQILTKIEDFQEHVPSAEEALNITEITNSYYPKTKLYEFINDIKIMLNIINTLNITAKDLHGFILQLCIWTPDISKYNESKVSVEEFNAVYREQYSDKFTEQKNDNGEIEYYEFKTEDNDLTEFQQIKITIQKTNSNLFKFLTQIKNLKTLFTKQYTDEVLNLLMFTANNKIYYIFKKELYDIIYSGANVASALNNFNNFTSNFQNNIIREQVNNFNQVKDSNIITYEPITYYKANFAFNRDEKEGNYWLLDIFENPQLLTFWLDFLEPTSAEMAKYSIPAIGIRSTVINDKDVKAIHYKDIPPVIFKNPKWKIYDEISGYQYINLTSGFSNLFAISSKGKTAKERIEELLYYHSYCTESVNISAIPIYTLEPNMKVYIRDDKCNINGEYIVNKITIPLNYKKMMNITATKAVQEII